MKQRTAQSGFGPIGIISIITAVVIIAGAGFTVYARHKNVNTKKVAAATATQTNTGQPASTTTTQPAPSLNVIKVPELGIQITVPDSIKDLIYKVGTATLHDARQETYVEFSTTALTTADSSCGTSFGPLGSLAKITGQYPTSFSDSDPPIEYGQLVKQFPTFFISASFPNGGNCSSSATAGSDVAATNNNNRASLGKQAFSSSLSTIQSTD